MQNIHSLGGTGTPGLVQDTSIDQICCLYACSPGQVQDKTRTFIFPKVVHMNCYRTESGHESINFTDTENLQEISPKEDSLTCPEHRKCNFSSSDNNK